ncbi:S1 RNA-binding domain-containing protein 1 isoform X2 [Gadus macrocephalus]|uniref:S1 RNA-binding domain-containing protein 1 isoform X2 n=1 Tax=Gadus macrocephalus TaxID=80720 RepID=UPI0028CB59E2|nr:S1 RNA-binding domain-containing protein 1 isoform X2 [Gadus macrocephalus]
MTQTTRTGRLRKEVKYTESDNDLSFSQSMSSEEDLDEWRPPEPKVSSETTIDPVSGKKKTAAKRTAKPKEPRAPKAPKEPRAPKAPKEPRAPKAPKEPKPRAPAKTPSKQKACVPRTIKASTSTMGPGRKRKHEDPVAEAEKQGGRDGGGQSDQPNSYSEGGKPSVTMKMERQSFTVADGPLSGGWVDEALSGTGMAGKKEENEDFTFDESYVKRQKTSGAPDGQPSALSSPAARALRNELNMNWDLIELLSTMTVVERWVCVNIVKLLREENTVPFMVRYRKDMINHMDADAVRDVQLVYEEICHLSKKTQSVIQTLRKDGFLNAELENNLRSCRSLDELDHMYSPYKKGSKLSKARRARDLGLEEAAVILLNRPNDLVIQSWVKPGSEGLSSLEEVTTGVKHILADMIAKDPESLAYIRTLCGNSFVTIQSSVSKVALKEQEGGSQPSQSQAKPGAKHKKTRDIDKFHLYFDFTRHIQRIQAHQTLAIYRGESLKILTVKVNIPDSVKSDFTRWCINCRWRPKMLGRPSDTKIIGDAVEDAYKRLILPLLTRSYRTKLSATAEKESIDMFVRNLRQRLLVSPIRGSVIMGVDPGFTHGCKIAVLSPTSHILHTDVLYLHRPGQRTEADRLRHLVLKYSCNKVVIGNGTACRETEAFFADLISRGLFQPLDVSYCITNEAGSSIYSVSPEAVKEMPELDPNLRSAVSIGRRVQDPLAELVKIDPKHIGIGTYQHDVQPGALKAALDGVVQECVSFVGVDINICSETLMRHVSGLNAGRARSIVEWREKNGPFFNREQLRLVKGMGPKSFQQCAGFIRINPHNLHSCDSAAPEKPAVKKSKGKAATNIPSTPNPFDQTSIHPESYHVAEKLVSIVGGSMGQIGSEGLRRCVETQVQASCLEHLARTLDTIPETLQLIVEGLTQPPGFDIRQGFEQADFKRGVVSMRDLQVGAVLTGRVENTALFGAFVDIGVGKSGLIHKSNITADRLPPSKRGRSLFLGPGERVEVRVLNVDPQRGRIGLDLLRVLQ